MKLTLLLLGATGAAAFTAAPLRQTTLTRRAALLPRAKLSNEDAAGNASSSTDADPKNAWAVAGTAAAVGAAGLLGGAPMAMAASDQLSTAIPSALAAYGHFFCLFVSVAALMAERVTVCDPNCTEEQFDVASKADIAYGLAGVGILISGYFRVTQYGKGWEFYQHEPIFWLKMSLLAVLGAASFFPTTKIIQRAIAVKNAEDAGAAGSVPPMSKELCARMTSIINAELLAIFSIPLAASLMARGVAYADWLPWQAGAAPVAALALGLGAKYLKEALDWKEPYEMEGFDATKVSEQ